MGSRSFDLVRAGGDGDRAVGQPIRERPTGGLERIEHRADPGRVGTPGAEHLRDWRCLVRGVDHDDVGSAVVLTFGVPDLPAWIGTANGNSSILWTPVASMYDWAANPCGTLPVKEGGANDIEF